VAAAVEAAAALEVPPLLVGLVVSVVVGVVVSALVSAPS
jgi:hypothetical protein